MTMVLHLINYFEGMGYINATIWLSYSEQILQRGQGANLRILKVARLPIIKSEKYALIIVPQRLV